MIDFPLSGVTTYWWLPIVVALVVSAFTSLGGLSGAFILLPFQVSVLHFTGPAVSPTNLVFNIIAIPSGVYRFWREKRMVWPLAWVIILGTLPGVFLGAIIRIEYLPDPTAFKLFAGMVLWYIGLRLLQDIYKNKTAEPPPKGPLEISASRLTLQSVTFTYNNNQYRASTPGLFILSLAVGIVGGIYGIGGGAIIAPFLVAVFGLPVHTIAGAALLGTFFTSIAGVCFYALIATTYAETGLAIAPDWFLGTMFGIGGAVGIYIGARIQKFIPAKAIKIILTVCLFFIAAKYIIDYFID